MGNITEYVTVRYLSQKEDKVADSVDGGHSEGILHQDEEGVFGRGAEICAVDGCRSVGVLKLSDADVYTVNTLDLVSTLQYNRILSFTNLKLLT